MLTYEILTCIFLGVGVGLLSSFLGFGGGTIIVPFLPFITNLDIKSTIATSLVIVTLNAANNTFNFHKKKMVPWNTVLVLALASVTFGVISSRTTHIVNEYTAKWAVVGVFFLVAVVAFLGPKHMPKFINNKTNFKLLIAGAMAGIMSGLGGIGGGTILIPVFIAGAWVANQQVAPTGNALNMLTAGAGALTLLLSGQSIHWVAVGIILLASTITSKFARSRQHLIAEKTRRLAIVIFLMSVIVMQIYKLLNVN